MKIGLCSSTTVMLILALAAGQCLPGLAEPGAPTGLPSKGARQPQAALSVTATLGSPTVIGRSKPVLYQYRGTVATNRGGLSYWFVSSDGTTSAHKTVNPPLSGPSPLVGHGVSTEVQFEQSGDKATSGWVQLFVTSSGTTVSSAKIPYPTPSQNPQGNTKGTNPPPSNSAAK